MSNTMALTRDFKATVLARVQADPAFAKALSDEAVTLFLNGEAETAKLILRDLVNATVGFEELALYIEKSPKSVHRMLSQSGNPTMSNLAAIFSALKHELKVEIQAHAVSIASLQGNKPKATRTAKSLMNKMRTPERTPQASAT